MARLLAVPSGGTGIALYDDFADTIGSEWSTTVPSGGVLDINGGRLRCNDTVAPVGSPVFVTSTTSFANGYFFYGNSVNNGVSHSSTIVHELNGTAMGTIAIEVSNGTVQIRFMAHKLLSGDWLVCSANIPSAIFFGSTAMNIVSPGASGALKIGYNAADGTGVSDTLYYEEVWAW